MTKYSKCGHKTTGVIILDDNVISMVNYFNWANGVGVFGDRTICFECWNKYPSKSYTSSTKNVTDKT